MPIARTAALALCAALAACAPSAAPAPAVPVEETRFAPSLNVDLSAMTRTPEGLYYRDLLPGTGAEARPGRTVSVRYAGFLPDGTLVDERRASTLSMRLGSSEIIRGWSLGIAGMREGGQRMIVLPPALAYGRRGAGAIPPGAVVVFVVELVDAG